jgi:hypothetical protein
MVNLWDSVGVATDVDTNTPSDYQIHAFGRKVCSPAISKVDAAFLRQHRVDPAFIDSPGFGFLHLVGFCCVFLARAIQHCGKVGPPNTHDAVEVAEDEVPRFDRSCRRYSRAGRFHPDRRGKGRDA